VSGGQASSDESSVRLTWRGRPLDLEFAWVGAAASRHPVVVFLHEGLGSVAMWKDFPARFCDAHGLRGLVYSRYGYGRSTPKPADESWDPDYLHRQATETLPPFLSTLRVERPWLFGHSDGASIAAIYAGSMQDHRVRGLVLIAPHFFTEDMGIAEIARAKETYATTDLRQKLSRWHADVDNAFRGWSEAWLDPAFRQWDITDVLAYIRVPILLVQGADDQYGTVAQIEAAQRECTCPVDVALLPGVRHVPHREAPDALLTTAVEFANRLLRDHKEGAMDAA
jgi:pimeloyl-ACP methyl ester carboxylesterase